MQHRQKINRIKSAMHPISAGKGEEEDEQESKQVDIMDIKLCVSTLNGQFVGTVKDSACRGVYNLEAISFRRSRGSRKWSPCSPKVDET
eukprot:95882-Amphidinium_carterae.1